ncbi:hypothetical protein AALP_AA5G090700 [Arabis alpina]|uniref:Uncharacterized protein n=1 Tax=Arabis alpina TaxID=50452 RepID=A0A087GVW1_ARAAL|nr:hypothetical protein AALP_AA5G090700 [Arabis alpina]
MGTMFPENGGYVVWVTSALEPYWGFQQGSGIPRIAAVLVVTIVLTYLNYRGLSIVGLAAVLLGVFSILPFVVMSFMSIPEIKPMRWIVSVVLYALVLVVVNYVFPVLAGTGGMPLDQKVWTDGYFADIGKVIGGAWLGWWIQAGAATSNMGMFLAEMSSDSFQLLDATVFEARREERMAQVLN